MQVSSAAATLRVTVTEPAWHRWEGAPPSRAYLAASHRHLFHVTADCESGHDNRELEFHDLADELRARFLACAASAHVERDMGGQSCEMLARRIAEGLAERHGRWFAVHVSEDGECGATVEACPVSAPVVRSRPFPVGPIFAEA